MRTAAVGIHGLPRRWGAAVAAVFHRDEYDHGKHARKFDVIHDIQNELQRVPLDAPEAAIYQAGEAAARECYRYCERYKLAGLIVDGIFLLCLRMGVSNPRGETAQEIIARGVDSGWWIRQLRKEHARRFEHTAIILGMTSRTAGAYLSHESAARQARRNAQVQKLLEQIKLENELGQTYTMAEIAALGTSNKAIRRGELMTRIRGFEEIAFDLGHVGMFWTITCPSKFHSVGGTNENYNGATPRQAQAYLVDVWKCIRSKLKRDGISTYGFRIAEPHTDGCPHWHMLLFVAPENQERMERVVTAYALAEDGDEAGAQKNRVKLVRIEAGMGTAAGYIAKYIGKNIDGECVGDHKDRDGNVLVPDLFGNQEFTPSQRVTYWSQLHGIRQFQQIGGAPVGVWRELRRVKAEAVANAPDAIKTAWAAVQKIESEDAAVAKRADFAAYCKAQGGVFVGRGACIKIAKKMQVVAGRYATREEEKPCGVYHVKQAHAVYESVRYQWTIKEGGGVAVAVPWTRVNNCTQVDYPALSKRMQESTKAAAQAVESKKFDASAWIDWPSIVREGRAVEKRTKDFIYRGNRV